MLGNFLRYTDKSAKKVSYLVKNPWKLRSFLFSETITKHKLKIKNKNVPRLCKYRYLLQSAHLSSRNHFKLRKKIICKCEQRCQLDTNYVRI